MTTASKQFSLFENEVINNDYTVIEKHARRFIPFVDDSYSYDFDRNDFLSGDYNLCVSNEIIEEYSEVLSRNISPQVSEAIVYAILTRPNVIRKDPHYTFALIEADKDDNKFVDCAIAANAKCIVTEDKHFKVLEDIPFPKVEVISIEDFKCYLDKWI